MILLHSVRSDSYGFNSEKLASIYREAVRARLGTAEVFNNSPSLFNTRSLGLMHSNKYTWCSKHIKFTDGKRGKKGMDKSWPALQCERSLCAWLMVYKSWRFTIKTVFLQHCVYVCVWAAWVKKIFNGILIFTNQWTAHEENWSCFIGVPKNTQHKKRERQREKDYSEWAQKKQNMLQPYSAVHCQFLSSTTAECIWSINWP